jgi:transcriptional regulator
MYSPKHFQEHRPELIRELVLSHPLATLVLNCEQGFQANHLPMLWQGEGLNGVLQGHIARANRIWQLPSAAEAGPNQTAADLPALAIFQAGEGYVSPGWYPSKHEHGKVVPTWNYAVVHVHGRLRFIHDPAWLESFLATLTDRNEAQRAHPWRITDAPEDYRQAQYRAIVGVELQIERVEAKFKLSQNRSASDYAGVVAGLANETEVRAIELRAWMRRQNDQAVDDAATSGAS